MDYSIVYYLTLFFSFCFWMYFDQMSKAIINSKVSKLKDVRDLNDVAIFFKEKDNRYLLFHIGLNLLFYLAIVIILNKLGIVAIVIAVLSFFIGLNLITNTTVLDNIFASENFDIVENKFDNKFDNKKLITYINIIYLSAITFTISLFIF